MIHSYIIIDDNPAQLQETKAMANGYAELQFLGGASNFEDGLDLILRHRPVLVFLEIDPADPVSSLSLGMISECYRYLKDIPYFIITTKTPNLALQALKYDVLDYLVKPLKGSDFRKAILRLFRSQGDHPPAITLPIVVNQPIPAKSVSAVDKPEVELNPETNTDEIDEPPLVPTKEPEAIAHPDKKPLIICVKSYGDYRFVPAADICYLQADNNSTDIHLNNGEVVTAFKTLKHFENTLDFPFIRIHNSYIVNSDHVSRIHTGNAVCYIRNSSVKLPFSKSYKENVEAIIGRITGGNYLEI